MSIQNTDIVFTIMGEPVSKANSRRAVRIQGRPAFIKSKKALSYSKEFEKQCPLLSQIIEGDVSVHIKIWYASRRPDLDESLILDLMQGKIYSNDRQVKRKLVEWMGVDKENPRAIISVVEIVHEN